jgi:hypothetical protein
MDICLDLHYLPSTAYISAAGQAARLWLAVDAPHQPKCHVNSCYIGTSQGVQRLVVPIRRVTRRLDAQQVEIDYSTRWRKKHLAALQAAYGKTPYYEEVMDLLAPIISAKSRLLGELQVKLFAFYRNFLPLTEDLNLGSNFEAARVLDLRGKLCTTTVLSGRAKSYHQRFGGDFIPNLSIVDLLFCEGTQAHAFL